MLHSRALQPVNVENLVDLSLQTFRRTIPVIALSFRGVDRRLRRTRCRALNAPLVIIVVAIASRSRCEEADEEISV